MKRGFENKSEYEIPICPSLRSHLNKKGVSPVVATVLLIAIVIVIALIIFLWFRGLAQDTIIKFDKNVELVCSEIQFNAQYDGNVLFISNDGNIPLYGFDVQVYDGDDYETERVDYGEDNNFGIDENGLTQGMTYSSSDFSEKERIVLIPILRGSTDTGKEIHVCEEKDGIEVYSG